MGDIHHPGTVPLRARASFIALDRGTLHASGFSLEWVREPGTVVIQCGAAVVLLLEPGVSVTHAAINIEREGLRLLAVSNTPMSGEIDARGDLGAVAGARIIALPQHRRSTNRELAARRCAPNRPRRRSGTGGEGGA